MGDRPIFFSGPMVRALLDGRKTQTRRVLDMPSMTFDAIFNDDGVWHVGDAVTGHHYAKLPVRHRVGDRLWVRETWSHTGDGVFEISQARIAPTGHPIYAATPAPDAPHAKYWPSIHMPREFSRLTLVVSDVRIERLHDISEADAIAEGSQEPSLRSLGGELSQAARSERQVYQRLWDRLNAKRGFGWDANPWVVAVSFDVVKANIDRMTASPHSPLQDRDANRG